MARPGLMERVLDAPMDLVGLFDRVAASLSFDFERGSRDACDCRAFSRDTTLLVSAGSRSLTWCVDAIRERRLTNRHPVRVALSSPDKLLLHPDTHRAGTCARSRS